MQSLKHYLHNLRTTKDLVSTLLKPHLAARGQRKIVIDYSSPNIAKRFHIGNLRSTLIGRFLDSLYRQCGDDVTSVNYLGDWGSQFAILAAYWPNIRPSDECSTFILQVWRRCTDLDKIKLLTNCYVEANHMAQDNEQFRSDVRKIFAEMENALILGNFENDQLKFWNEVRDISVRHLEDFYRLLRIKFDRISNESDFVKHSQQIVNTFLDRQIAQQSADGMIIVKDPQIEGYATVRKSDGSSLYLSRCD
ncbi:unnamed protein product [Anisakis simplex]|uniref:Probable arginine--tRNA ligase, mitochondrial n=1 Tax=Anisakis simplex TaxID=6269 RepID=A0A0M3J239_ANISI|nr:unnamed protein product [Anisakis simplex]